MPDNRIRFSHENAAETPSRQRRAMRIQADPRRRCRGLSDRYRIGSPRHQADHQHSLDSPFNTDSNLHILNGMLSRLHPV